MRDSGDGVCREHAYIERTMESLVGKVDAGFQAMNSAIADLRVDLAHREESEKGQWHEIRRLRERVEEMPDKMAESLSAHVANCPLQDITEVGIKIPPKDRGGASERASLAPSTNVRLNRKLAICIGAGVVLAIAGLGIWIGVVLSTGSTDRATGTVRNLAEKAMAPAAAQADAP
jgi:hypothetical protein